MKIIISRENYLIDSKYSMIKNYWVEQLFYCDKRLIIKRPPQGDKVSEGWKEITMQCFEGMIFLEKRTNIVALRQGDF